MFSAKRPVYKQTSSGTLGGIHLERSHAPAREERHSVQGGGSLMTFRGQQQELTEHKASEAMNR